MAVSAARKTTSAPSPSTGIAPAKGRAKAPKRASSTVPLQAKLKINEPNDRFEREADNMAEHVMHAPERTVSHAGANSGFNETVNLQRTEIEEDEELQRSTEPSDVEDENLQMAQVQQSDEEEEVDTTTAQRKPSHQTSQSASTGFESKLQALKAAGGRPLDTPIRQFMENRFARSFSQVRIHTGPAAESLAKQASARAFTVGRHLVFGNGEYRPGVEQGMRLVAHELTHVLQQQGGLHSVQREILEQAGESDSRSNTDLLQLIRNMMDMDGAAVPTEVANFSSELIGAALRSPDGNLLRAMTGASAANVSTERTIETGEFSLALKISPRESNALANWSLSKAGETGAFFSHTNNIAESDVADAQNNQALGEADTASLFVATPTAPLFSDASAQALSSPLVSQSPSAAGTAANEPEYNATPTVVSGSSAVNSTPDVAGDSAAATPSTESATTDGSSDTAAEGDAAATPPGPGDAAVEILIPEPPSELSGAERGRIGSVRSNASSAQAATTDMPAASESARQARGAVDEPVEETNARAQSDLVEALGIRPEPSPEIEALCLRIYEVIRSKRPVDEDALVEADPTDMASSAGQELNQGIQNDVDSVGSSYDELEQPQEGTPQQVGGDMQTPATSVPTPDLNATRATPDGVSAEAVDVGPDVTANAQRISDAGMDTEVAQQIQDPDNPVVAGRDAQSGLEEVAERAPAEVLLEQEGLLQQASASMAERQALAVQALANARLGAANDTTGQQTEMVGSEEDMRVQASARAEVIFRQAQTSVKELLTPLTDDAMGKWDAGVTLLSTKFEQKLKRVADWIDDRHSGGLGAVVGVWDAVTGLPGWVTEEYDEAEKEFGDGVCDLIRKISIDVNLVVTAAESLIDTARTSINNVFSELPTELQDWATQQQDGFTRQLDGLEQEASDTRQNFNKEITRSASEAVDEVRVRVETLREEAGGLIGMIVSAVNDFIDDPVKFIIEGLLKLVGIPPPSFWALINRIEQVVSDIADDPLNFANNMAAALGQGFQKFFDHFVDHVMAGFFEWLFSGLGAVGVNIPSDTSLKSIVTLFLELMGITWPRIRELLARHIGEENVELIEKAYELVSSLIEQGPEGIFEMIKEQLDPQNVLNMVIDAAIDFMITALISAVTPRVIAMFNPAGAIVQAVEVIFRILKWVFDNAARIFSLIETVVNGAADLIAGNIGAMATAVEESLSRLIPPVIDFLAGFLGMGDLPDKIADTIRGFQEWVMSILERVVAWLAERGKALLASLGIGGGAGDEEGEGEAGDGEVGKTVTFGEHRLWLNVSGASISIMVASDDPGPVEEKLNDWAQRTNTLGDNQTQAEDLIGRARGQLTVTQSEGEEANTEQQEAQQNPDDQTQAAEAAAADAEVEQAEESLASILVALFELFDEEPDINVLVESLIDRPLSDFQGELNKEDSFLGEFYLVNINGRISRKSGKKDEAPKLRAVSGIVKPASGSRFTHWPIEDLSTSGGRRSGAKLGALAGAGTAPASIAYGLDANGHLIGAQFGGSNGADNISPMQGKVNSPTFSAFENSLKNKMVETNIRVKMEVSAQGSQSGQNQAWINYTSLPETQAKIERLRGSLDRKDPPHMADYLGSRPVSYQVSISGFEEVFNAGSGPSFAAITGQGPLSQTMDNPIREEQVSTGQMSSSTSSVTNKLDSIRDDLDKE